MPLLFALEPCYGTVSMPPIYHVAWPLCLKDIPLAKGLVVMGSNPGFCGLKPAQALCVLPGSLVVGPQDP